MDELTPNADASKVIEELLQQNSQLRLELATLTALHKQKNDVQQQMKQSSNIPPEAMELISKLDIK